MTRMFRQAELLKAVAEWVRQSFAFGQLEADRTQALIDSASAKRRAYEAQQNGQ